MPKLGEDMAFKPRLDASGEFLVLGGSGVLDTDEAGRAMIGRASADPARPVSVDFSRSHVVAVTGQPGSGKSYGIATFLEALGRSKVPASALVIDVEGEFSSLKRPNRDPEQVRLLRTEWGLTPRGLPDALDLVPPEPAPHLPPDERARIRKRLERADGKFALGPWDPQAEHWCAASGVSGVWEEASGILFFDLMQQVRAGYHTEKGAHVPGESHASFGDLIRAVQQAADLVSSKTGYARATRAKVEAALEEIATWGFWARSCPPLAELLAPGRILVLDASHMSSSARAMLAAFVLDASLSWRLAARQRQGDKGLWPLFFVIDELQDIVGARESSPVAAALSRYVKHGRVMALSLLVGTQLPSAIPADVRSQCDLVFGYQLTSKPEYRSFADHLPAWLRPPLDKYETMMALAPGQCIVADAKTPSGAFLMQTRPRLSEHTSTGSL